VGNTTLMTSHAKVTLLYFDGHYNKPYLTTTGDMSNESSTHASKVQ